MTTILNSYGEKAGSVDQIMDSLINTQNTGKTTVDELASSMGKIIPIANGAGVEFNDLNGAMATLTAGGISTSESTTYLKSMLNELAKSGTKVSDILKNETGQSFQELMESGMPLSDTLRILKEHAEKNGLAFNDLFGSSEAATAAMALMEDGGETLDQKIKEISETTGSANEAFEKMDETTGNTLAKAFNNLKLAIMEMGDVLAPVVEKLAECINKVADWFSSLDENAQQNVVTFGLLAAAIAPLLIFLGNILIVGGNAVSLFGALSGGGGALAGVLGGLSGVALPALCAALVGLATYIGGSETAILGLQEKFGGLGTVIGGVCEFISGVVQFTFGTITSHIQLAFDLMAAIIDGPGGATMEQAYEAHAQRLLDNSEESWDKMTLSTTRGMSQMRNASDEQLEGTVASMQTILNSVPSIVDGSYGAAAVTLGNQLATMDSTQITILKGMNDTTKAMFDGIREGMDVDEATAKVKSNLEGMAKSGKIDVETLEKDATTAMEQMQRQMSESTKKGADDVNKNTKQAQVDASKNTQELAKEIDKNTKQAQTNADKNTKEAAKSVETNTGKMAQDAKTNSSKVATDMDTDFKKANKSIQQESTNMYNGAKQSFTKLAEIAKQAGTDMYNGIRVSAEKMASSAKSAASDMYRGVTTSTSKMASQAIADWNRVRSAYATPIVAKISVTKTQTTVTQSEQALQESRNMFNTLSDEVSTFATPVTFATTVDEEAVKSLEEKLRKTNDIEKKITQIYQKEVEKRKKLIDSELKAKLDSLKKEQDAYNQYKSEIDYANSYEDQLNAINELQNKLDIAKSDSSLSGQKRVQELMKQIQEEQKQLENLVSSKLDSDINDMFNSESDRLTEEANKAKDELDNILDPSNLQNLVSEALKTGMFKDLEGNFISLKDVMLDFEDTFGDGLSSIGALIKSELIDNLNQAKDTIKDFTNILGQLGIGGFNSSQYATRISALDYSSDLYRNNKAMSDSLNGIRNSRTSSNDNPITINFNQPLCTIEGNVDKNVLPDLEQLLKLAEKRITKNIINSVNGR